MEVIMVLSGRNKLSIIPLTIMITTRVILILNKYCFNYRKVELLIKYINNDNHFL